MKLNRLPVADLRGLARRLLLAEPIAPRQETATPTAPRDSKLSQQLDG